MTAIHRNWGHRAGANWAFAIIAAFLLSVVAATGARAEGNEDDRSFAAPSPGKAGFVEPLPTAGPYDPEKAIVVVGLAANTYNVEISEIKVKFGRYDPASGLALPNETAPDEFLMERRTRSLLFQFGQPLDPTVPEYGVFQIPPGEWVLYELYSVTGDPTNLRLNTTRLFAKAETRRGQSLGPRFAVKAGEAIYVGTAHVNAVSFPNVLERITSEEEPAKDALLKKYPEAAGRFAYRHMFFKR